MEQTKNIHQSISIVAQKLSWHKLGVAAEPMYISLFPYPLPLPYFFFFLVACYATLHPALSVRQSVGRLVPILLFLFVLLFDLTAPAQMV